MSDFDDLARRHASAARATYASVQPPSPEILRRGRRGTARRSSLTAGVVGMVLAAMVAVVVGVVSRPDFSSVTPAWTGEDSGYQTLPPPKPSPTPAPTPTPTPTPSPIPVPLLTPEVDLPDGWEVLGDLPFDAGSRIHAAPLGDSIIVVGRTGLWRVHADGTWVEGQAGPFTIPVECCGSERLFPAATGPVFIRGSSDGTWVLDPGTLTWRRGQARPTTANDILGGVVVGGSLAVVEAAPREGEDPSSSVAFLDLDTLAWHEVEKVPEPISMGGVTSDGDRLIVAGTRQGPLSNIIGDHVAFQYTHADGWERLPDVPISGQSPTVQWIDGVGLLAWNYDQEAAVLPPGDTAKWQRIGDVPMEFGECSPQMSPAPGGALGQCGGLAWFDAATQRWSPIPMDERRAGKNPLSIADYLTSGDAVVAIFDTEASTTRLVKYPLSALTGAEPGNK